MSNKKDSTESRTSQAVIPGAGPTYDPTTDPALLHPDGHLRRGIAMPAGLLLACDYQQPLLEIIGDGVLDERSLMVLVGEPKIRKTTFLMNLAHHLAFGLPWPNFRIERPFKVVYVYLEGSEDRTQERYRAFFNAWIEGHPTADLALMDNLIFAPVVPFQEEEAGTVYEENPPMLDEDTGFRYYHSLVVGYAPDVLIIDPLRPAHSQDENSSQAMAKVFAALRRLANAGPGVIVAHHASDKQAIPGAKRKGAAKGRGTSDLHARPESLLWLDARGEDTEREYRELGSSLRNGPDLKVSFAVRKADFFVEPVELEPTKGQAVEWEILQLLADRQDHLRPDVARAVEDKGTAQHSLIYDVIAELCKAGRVEVVGQQKRGRNTVDVLRLAEGVRVEEAPTNPPVHASAI